jgi:hypothetical protein
MQQIVKEHDGKLSKVDKIIILFGMGSGLPTIAFLIYVFFFKRN